MKFVKNSKRGSAAVMLAMLFVCLMMVAVILIQASAAVSTYSYSDAVISSAGRSILSEYHLALKDMYGIIAYKSYEKKVNAKLEFYINASFNRQLPGKLLSKKNNITFLKPKASNISCDLKAYSLANIDIFETEIEEIMKYNMFDIGINYITKGININSDGVNNNSNKKNIANGSDKKSAQRELVNQKIINGLPSKGLGSNGINLPLIVANGMPSWEEITEKGSAKFFVNEYILNYFSQRYNDVGGHDSFFQNEVEYVLYGDLCDSENAASFIKNFKTLRLLLNSIHVYADTEKRNEIAALAQIITPGPEAIVTAVLLSEAWAYAESINDVKLIEAGEKVALIKGKETWALSLTNALNNLSSKKYVKPNIDEGYSYKDYLRLFLYFENRETKLLRVMDLIQINIKLNVDKAFYVEQCYIGLKYEASVNGQRYCYVQTY